MNALSSPITFQGITDEVIEEIESFAREDMLTLLQKKFVHQILNFETEVLVHFFGDLAHDTTRFRFDQADKEMIYKCNDYIKQNILRLGLKDSGAHFQNSTQIKLCAINDYCFVDTEISPIEECQDYDPESNIQPPSHTHSVLKMLFDEANKNLHRPKEGHRFSPEILDFAMYTRMLSGRMAYENLQQNLSLSLPSVSTVDRHIHRCSSNVIEGVLRCDELRQYLLERNCQLNVCLSEDATRIDNTVQYCKNTNQLMGFVLPTDYTTGLPIPFAFKARTASEMLRHFSTETARHVITVMAKPIENVPAFCLLIYGSSGKFTADVVANRWNTITERLKNVGINVLTIASDSDTRYNSAMRVNSMLGVKPEYLSEALKNVNWFRSGNASPPFYIQDPYHIGTKLRNLLLKTLEYLESLPFGEQDAELFIQINHLKHLLKHFGKDEHLLTETTINPTDRQNFDSVLRICSETVRKLLEKHVGNSEATVMFLDIVYNSIMAFIEPEMMPLERIDKAWYSLFMVRFWREYISAHPVYRLKDNFMSSYCYACLELNAHSLVSILLHLRQTNQPHLFAPQIYDSQPCESFYRQIRSFTSVYSTVANCSTKEIISRIGKIQLQSDISHRRSSQFNFARFHKIQMPNVIPDLPSENEIVNQIEQCRQRAISDARKFNLITENSRLGECTIKEHTFDLSKSNKRDEITWENPMFKSRVILLKNYAYKFRKDEDVDIFSSYVEIPLTSKRLVVKKTSFCWLLRSCRERISSDRLQRVKASTQKVKSRRRKTYKSFPRNTVKRLPRKLIQK